MNDPNIPPSIRQLPPVSIPSNLGKPGGPRFLDVLCHHIGIKLQKFTSKSLDDETMGAMYLDIHETVDAVFSQSSQNLTDGSRRWLSQKLYETIRVSDSAIITRDEETWNHTVRPIYERVTLETAPDSDVRLIAGLFDQASFAGEISDELRRRGMR